MDRVKPPVSSWWLIVPAAIIGLAVALVGGDSDRSPLKPGTKATVYGPPGTAAIRVEGSSGPVGIRHIPVGTRVTVVEDRGAPRRERPVAIRLVDRDDDVREVTIGRQYLRPVPK